MKLRGLQQRLLMKLSSSRKREIRQLWDAAFTYWNLARGIKADMPQDKMQLTSAEIAQYYETQIPSDQNLRGLNILLAHLSSAAIRLYTIEERLGDPKRVFPYNYLKCAEKKKRPSIWLDKHFVDIVHQLLRDNAAHIEKGTARAKEKERLYRARQEVIRNKKVEEIFNAFERVMTKFANELPRRIVMSTPSS